MNPEIDERRVRFSEHYSKSPPWLQPFAVALRHDGHLCIVNAVPGTTQALAKAYGLERNGRCGVEGRAFNHQPSREQLRKLWLDIFDSQFPKGIK